MIYPYKCHKCGEDFELFRRVKDYKPIEKCPKCGTLCKRIFTPFAVLGSRDTFGIGKEFVDERSGKVIDNWKSWEKAGYRDIESISNSDVKKQVKEKRKKLRGVSSKPLEHTSLPL